MNIIEVENIVERVYSCSYSIKTGLRKTPLYDYYHQGTEFKYIHTMTLENNLHRIIIDNKSVLDINILTNEISYMVDNEVITHALDISEEWHFQLSTVKPLISYDHIQMVKNILNIIS